MSFPVQSADFVPIYDWSPCLHCYKPNSTHVNEKCLFMATEFKLMTTDDVIDKYDKLLKVT